MKSDENLYVRFRAAFALTEHNPGEYRDEVIDVLHEAKNDENVSDRAKQCLEKV